MGTANVTVEPPLETVEQRLLITEHQSPEIMQRQMDDLADLGLIILRDEAPKRTGAFAAGIGYYLLGSGEKAEIHYYLPQPLGTWLTEGTGVFGPTRDVIRPVRAKALHFFIDGQEIFAKWVLGMAPNSFMDRARARMAVEVGITANRIGQEIVGVMAGGA